MPTNFPPYDSSSKRPRDVVLSYLDLMWNKSNPEAARLYVGEHQWRHDPKNYRDPVQRYSIDENLKRLRGAFMVSPRQIYIPRLLVCEGDDVSVVWESEWYECNVKAMESMGYSVDANGTCHMAGIEVFRVRDGKIVEIWNAYSPEARYWGETQVA